MSRLTRVTVICVAILLVSLISVASLWARGLAQLPRPPRNDTPLHFPQLPAEAKRQSAQPMLPSATAGYGAWSKITFQSYRDGNWEIYLANQDNTSQMRLTANAASDVYPRLNRGGTRIAFSSNRTGIYEIYTMNPDGSGLSQLTTSTNNNYDPAWSPDGSKIAFESFRDGQAEVYVMNANGTGLTRLTNNPAFDGHPAWSPDGMKIAFTSDRGTPANTGNRVWIMNADGSSPQQLTTQYYCQDPVWSPNGTRIAFDADATNDGSQEVWLMNADGSGQTQWYDPPDESPLGYPGLTDAWVRSWSPDGYFIAFTRLTWIYYRGSWYWYTGYLEAIGTGDTSASPSLLVPTQGDDWYPDWQTLDLQSPTSGVNGLPPYSRNPVNVAWTGQDSGGSGLMSYDLQYQVDGNGTWTNWLMATTAYSATFSNTPGHTYRFRVRARDYSGNLGNWSADNDATTTLYTWKARGLVRDNRDTSISGATLNISPTALVMFPSDSQGNLLSYVATNAITYNLTARKDGYGSLPGTPFNAAVDGYLVSTLPPANDIVQNGNFEANLSTLDGWTIGGELTPTVFTRNYHTGQGAALLGPATFEVSLTAPTMVGGGVYSFPRIAADRSGTLHLVYVSTFDGIYYASRTREGNWSTSLKIGSYGTSSTGSLPQLAVTPEGEVHVTWNGELGIYYSHRLLDGTWTPQIVISPALAPSSSDYCRDQYMVVDSQHGVHVAYWCWRSWQQELYHRHRLPDGSWLANEYLGDGREPQITIGPDDTLYLTAGTSYRERPPNGVWGLPQSLPCTYYSRMIVDGAGTLHVTCDGGYANKPRGLPWSARIPLDKLWGIGEMAADSNGIIYLVNASGFTYFRYRRLDGTWTEPEAMTTEEEYSSPAIAVDYSDNLHLVYYHTPANVYRTNTRVSAIASSIMTQTLTVAGNVYSPTLSFWYALSGSDPGAFTADVVDDLSATTVFSTLQSTDWTHAWADLSPWAGQTITLVMTARSEVGGTYTRARLDEVSVGSSYPNSWINLDAEPRSAPAGSTVVYRVSFGNRGGVPANGVGITVTLPSDLIIADVSPLPTTTDASTIQWTVGDLSARSSQDIIMTTTIAPTATVMSTLTSTAIIESSSPELEMANNVTLVKVFVGYQNFLPIIRR